MVCIQSAVDDLVGIWLAGDDRHEVTLATSIIDHELQMDAQSKGMELAEGLRSLNAPPLRAIFVARKDDRIAESFWFDVSEEA